MGSSFTFGTMIRRGVLNPIRPDRLLQQLAELRSWGYGLAGALRAGAVRRPNRVAVADDSRALTYDLLLERSLRLANGLRGVHGVGQGENVGILCRNSVAMVEAMAGLAIIGAIPVLINTALGPEPLEVILREQNIRVLIHDDDLYDLLPATPSRLLRISADGDPRRPSPTLAGIIAASQPTPVQPPKHPSTIVVLTSGTTGVPKGARRPNAPGIRPLSATLSRLPLRTGERMLIASPLFHTWGMTMLQVCLALGGTAVLRRRFRPIDAARALAEHRCTCLVAVPVMLQRMLDQASWKAGRQRVRLRSPRHLRTVVVSGSMLPGSLATRFMDTYGGVLYNLYGSTEVSAVSIATPDELRREPSCAGRPPRGTSLRILGARGENVPKGQIGRIFVNNDLLFAGYTDGTPYESRDGMLATGDLGHVDDDGVLYVHGREDDMVISGGENVYPSTVEDVLTELPQVREVAVAGVEDQEYGQRLAAWIVLKDGERLDAEAVREYVRHRLARFSVPREVHFLDWLPRNATGKVVTRRLRTGGGQT